MIFHRSFRHRNQLCAASRRRLPLSNFLIDRRVSPCRVKRTSHVLKAVQPARALPSKWETIFLTLYIPKKARRSGQSLKLNNQPLVGVVRPELMTGWFARTATLLLLAFPNFLSSLLLLITILLMAVTLLLRSAFQFFLFLSVHLILLLHFSRSPSYISLREQRTLGL